MLSSSMETPGFVSRLGYTNDLWRVLIHPVLAMSLPKSSAASLFCDYNRHLMLVLCVGLVVLTHCGTAFAGWLEMVVKCCGSVKDDH